MAAIASAAEIPPGGEGAIKATLSTRRRAGKISKTIRVETDDPENSIVNLVLKANIVVEADLDPSYFNFAKVDLGETATQTAEFQTHDEARVKLTKLELVDSPEGVTAKVIKVDGGSAVQVKLKGLKVGSVRHTLKVHTSSEKQPVFDVLIRAKVLGAWDLSTSRVFFSEPREAEEGAEPVVQKRTIQITPRGKTRHKVIKAVDPQGVVSTKLTPTKEGYSIEVTLSEVSEKRRGVIQITTSDPQEKTLEVRYMVRRGRERKIPARPIIRPPVVNKLPRAPQNQE